MKKIAVIGAGSWGTALAVMLEQDGHDVTMWARNAEAVENMKQTRENKQYLPGVLLGENIDVTTDAKKAIAQKEIVISAVPSRAVRETMTKFADLFQKDAIVVNVAKGLEQGSLLRLSEVIKECLPNCYPCVLSGPSHAEEVGHGLPTTCVAGAKTREAAEYVQNVFMNDVFRVYTSPDMLGIELGGALKNVIALAAGMADGLGYGDNTKAALITRGITEIGRLALVMGAKYETLSGLTGIGDLIVTCASIHSRNRKAGMLIGQGKSMEEAMEEVHMVVEGVYSAKAAKGLSEKYQVPMPIIEEVNRILFEGEPVREAVQGLMLRDKKAEHEKLWEDA